jgi:outer membrane protein, multidrug efflux system
VWAAQRAVLAASADVQATDADQRPRLSLSGQLMPVRSIGVGVDATVWSLGPVQLSVPLWDGGRRQSASAVSRVAYDEAVSQYHASVRTAVREVETALIELHSIRQRETDAATATDRLTHVLKATTERQRAGLANVLELEEVRRTALSAQLSLIELARDRAWAWIDLYRVLGGGWEAAAIQP